MVAIRWHRLSKSIQTVRHRDLLAMLCSEAQFNFYLLNKSLAADRDRLRPEIVSSRYVSAQSCFDPFKMRLLKFSNISETAKLTQRQKIDDAIALQMAVGSPDTRCAATLQDALPHRRAPY